MNVVANVVEAIITRHRHQPKRRKLTVRDKTNITPGMIRLVLEGGELEDFVSMSPDDHVKLFVTTSSGEVERRDYTPRLYDPVKHTLAIDFAVHDAGPATRWALNAAPGDVLEVGGPRGSAVVSPAFDWWLLVGDETALPAIGRRIEEMPAGAAVTSVVAVASAAEEQRFTTHARHAAVWAHRPIERADDPAPLLAALQTVVFPAGRGFVWIAAEAGVARAVRDHVVNARHHPLAHLKAAGYWRKGVADVHDKLED